MCFLTIKDLQHYNVFFAIFFEEFDLTNPGFVLCFFRKADKFGIYNLCSVSVKQILSKIVNEAGS